MAPVQNAVLVAVPAAQPAKDVPAAKAEAWEIKLVKETTSRLAQKFTQKPQHRIINELLTGLLEEKQARQASNLNHWPEYGPKFLARLAVQWKADEAKRIKRIPVFLKERHKNAVRFALAVTDNLPDAEAAVSETDLDLLSGAVKEESYLVAVKMDALDLVRRRQVEQGKYVPLEEAFDTAGDGGEDSMEGMGGAERLDCEPSGQGCDEMDPLEILVRREEQKGLDRLFKAALKDPRWRYIKRLQWASPLVECAKSARRFDY